ncbi:WLM domain-domain-containing protein [Protomyces lactucae-debilis]|uniref:WLM domain-domain-containing protein n=1 Tax=Protomyces lactucae-debilis TaxID=2754530 RepID=A0A1Y2FC61_PROLT|nr:WLM domain-containing protein [Protomyces lactucae-debilis]ORY81004.1 WLM domain-domain-containing protein [Protomyces lactucae-debilis]
MMLLVSSQAAVAEMNQSARAAAEKIAARQNRQAGKINKTAASSTDTAFRFHRITCLTHLPNHERSLAYLHRLAEDRCICKLMQQEKYTVGLLTEMDPRLHTSHDSKTLGLNKNAGQEILLRLRTDTLDGWRDYKGVRATLLHELTHNVHSEHDKHFFALLGKHSKDVQRWEAGHTLQPGEVFVPTESLVSSCGTQSETHQLGSTSPEEPATDAREARARAAEFRANQAQRD